MSKAIIFNLAGRAKNQQFDCFSYHFQPPNPVALEVGDPVVGIIVTDPRLFQYDVINLFSPSF